MGLKYAVYLQARNSAALGFISRTALEDHAKKGRMFLGLLDGGPCGCGYLLTNGGWQGTLRLTQVAIEYTTRRRLYGAILVQAAEDFGRELGCTQVTLRCGAELEVNEFWKSLNYTILGKADAGARFSHLNIWGKNLNPVWIAEAWKNGRPRVYPTNADRQKAYRLRRRRGFVMPVNTGCTGSSPD